MQNLVPQYVCSILYIYILQTYIACVPIYTCQVDGLPLRIVDTAGLRPTEDPVERMGIARTWAAVEEADAVLAVVDDRQGLDAADRELLARLPRRLPRIVVHNKIDLTGAPPGPAAPAEPLDPDPPDGRGRLPAPAEDGRPGEEHRIFLSARTGAGVEALRERLKTLAGYTSKAEGLFMARRRHLAALDDALTALDTARSGLDEGAGSELLAEDLRLAQRALGEITGEFTTDDLLGRIFATFCLGK